MNLKNKSNTCNTQNLQEVAKKTLLCKMVDLVERVIRITLTLKLRCQHKGDKQTVGDAQMPKVTSNYLKIRSVPNINCSR